MGLFGSEVGSPGIVRKTVANISAGSTEFDGRGRIVMSIRNCWFGSPP